MTRRVLVIAVAAAVGALLIGGTAEAKPKASIVYQTLPPSAENTFFDITTLYHPQLAQSLHVKKPMTWDSVEMGTSQVKLINEPRALEWLVDGKYDEKWFTSYFVNYKVKARVTLELWRYDGEGEIPERLDLEDGFTLVYRSILKSKKIAVGNRVTFPLRRGVEVEPGRYLFVIGMTFPGGDVFNLRFTGQENGTNTMGGYEHDQPLPVECTKYRTTKDSHPGGLAYQQIPQRKPTAPDWTAGFSKQFEVVETKVAMPCDTDGKYGDENQIWNPGDLGLAFRGVRG